MTIFHKYGSLSNASGKPLKVMTADEYALLGKGHSMTTLPTMVKLMFRVVDVITVVGVVAVAGVVIVNILRQPH